MHGRFGKHIQMSLKHSVLWLQDKHWHIDIWLERVERFIVLLYDLHLSMMLECNYLLREDEQLMHECHQQKLHLYNIYKSCTPSWSLLGSSKNCFSRATIMHVPSEWGWNKSTDGEYMGSSLDNSTRGYTSLQRTDMMWLQKRLQRTLQVCSQVHCTLFLWCSECGF